MDRVHESNGERAIRVDVLARVGQFGDVAGTNDLGQSLQRAEVGHDGDLGLTNRKLRVRGAQSDVTGAHEIDAAADAVAVDGRDDWHVEVGNGCNGVLHCSHRFVGSGAGCRL